MKITQRERLAEFTPASHTLLPKSCADHPWRYAQLTCTFFFFSFFFCILFIYLFILFYRYKTRTYRSIRRNITKFTTNTLITNYKGKKKLHYTTLHYTTLQGFHNLFNLNLKKSNLGKVWITATVVLMGVKVSIFYCGNEFCCFFSR